MIGRAGDIAVGQGVEPPHATATRAIDAEQRTRRAQRVMTGLIGIDSEEVAERAHADRAGEQWRDKATPPRTGVDPLRGHDGIGGQLRAHMSRLRCRRQAHRESGTSLRGGTCLGGAT